MPHASARRPSWHRDTAGAIPGAVRPTPARTAILGDTDLNTHVSKGGGGIAHSWRAKVPTALCVTGKT